MAGTENNLIRIPLVAARDLVIVVIRDRMRAEGLVLKWLHQGRVRWWYAHVDGLPGYHITPGQPPVPPQSLVPRTLEEEVRNLWSSPARILVDWQNGIVRKATHYGADGRTPKRDITVFGIDVAKEDIEAQLALLCGVVQGMMGAGAAVTEPQAPEALEAPIEEEEEEEKPTKLTLDSWLPEAIRDNPRNECEDLDDYFQRLANLPKAKWKASSIETTYYKHRREGRG
jgi:hypothetical protein